MNYKILKPPIIASFELPTREELLSAEINGFCKLMFEDKKSKEIERMWIKITKINWKGKWKGTLSNTPLGINMKYGEKIEFWPLDTIDYLPPIKTSQKG